MLFNQANAKYFAMLWLALMVLCACLLAAKIPSLQFETNILALLPTDKRQQENPLIEKALAQKSQYSQRMIFLVGAVDEDSAASGAQQLAEQLLSFDAAGDALFKKVQWRINADEFVGAYQPLLDYRFQLLSDADRQALESSADSFLSNHLQALYSPLGLARLAVLETDPAYTFSAYLQSLQTEQVELYNDIAMFNYQGKHYALVDAELSDSLKMLAANRQLLSGYETLHAWAAKENIELLSAGLPFYNAFAQQQAESEISSIGMLSLIMIICIVLLCFRSIKPLLLSLWVIASGVLLAFTLSSYLFTKVHMITLVFGSSLIGVAVDYAFHYLCGFFQKQEGASAQLKKVFKGISLGMLSSVLAYGALAFSPFPGLQQIAVFSALGLLGAWLTVILLLPLLLANFKPMHALPLSHFYPAYLKHWPHFLSRYRGVLSIAMVLYLLCGFYFFHATDDIRQLEPPHAELYSQEKKVKAITQQQQASQFFLVSGDSLEQLMVNEKTVTQQLSKLHGQALLGHQALSDSYSNAKQQQADYLLFKQQLISSNKLAAMLNDLGLEPEYIEAIEQAFAAGSFKVLAFDDWLQAMSEPTQALFLGCKPRCASMISLSGIAGAEQLAVFEKMAVKNDAITWVDPVANVNEVLREYRDLSVYFIAFSLLAVGIVLSLFLGINAAWRILLTPLLAMLICVATLSFLPVNFSLFNVFALLLVLGISLDYAIFQYLAAGHQQTTALAILLSLVTTLMAFGLLALSNTMLIQTFGMTLAIGVAVAFLVAPLSRQKGESYEC